MDLIIANLDCEYDFALSAGYRPPSLSKAARYRAAELGTLLRVLALDHSVLWLPHPIDRRRIPHIEGLPSVDVACEPLSELCQRHAMSSVLPWGETEKVSRLRRNRPEECRGTMGQPSMRALHHQLRSLKGTAEASCKVNNRCYQHQLCRHLAVNVPGASMISSSQHIRQYDAKTKLVFKVPFSAAGRSQLRCTAQEARTAPNSSRIANMLRRWGNLIVEPWMTRTADYGGCFLATDAGIHLLGYHEMMVNRHCAFSAIRVYRGRAALDDTEHQKLHRIHHLAGTAISTLDYRGHFGIDFWRYDDCGNELIHPLGEVNARLTFGLIARLYSSHIFSRHPESSQCTLHLSNDATTKARPDHTAENTLALLRPERKHDLAAWIEWL